MTSFVNADPHAPGRLLGLAPGRTGACVKGWLAAQTPEFRAGIAVVVIDPSAPYASGIRAALPDALIAVDHFHLVQLGNQMVTDVRQRVAREQLGRRGRATDGPWAHRRMLLTAGDRLSARQLARLGRVLDADDPTQEIGAAWACKELLRLALQARDPWDIRDRMWRFHTACADADMPETTRLGDHGGHLVAAHPGVPAAAGHERPDRGLQPDHQAGQARRLRLPQHGQLRTPHTGPHRAHPSRVTSSMNRPRPAENRRALKVGEPSYLGGASAAAALPTDLPGCPTEGPITKTRGWGICPSVPNGNTCARASDPPGLKHQPVPTRNGALARAEVSAGPLARHSLRRQVVLGRTPADAGEGRVQGAPTARRGRRAEPNDSSRSNGACSSPPKPRNWQAAPTRPQRDKQWQ